MVHVGRRASTDSYAQMHVHFKQNANAVPLPHARRIVGGSEGKQQDRGSQFTSTSEKTWSRTVASESMPGLPRFPAVEKD